MSTNNNIRDAIDFRKGSIPNWRDSVQANVLAAAAGGLMMGVGFLGEVTGLYLNSLEIELIAPVVFTLGALVVHDSYRDAKQNTQYALEDQAYISAKEASLDTSSQ